MSGIYRHKGSRKQAPQDHTKSVAVGGEAAPADLQWARMLGDWQEAWVFLLRMLMITLSSSWGVGPGTVKWPMNCHCFSIRCQWDDLRCIPTNAQGEILDEWTKNIQKYQSTFLPALHHRSTACSTTGPAASIRCCVAWLLNFKAFMPHLSCALMLLVQRHFHQYSSRASPIRIY